MNVSIITPTYNSSKYITKTIDSVIIQTYTDWELIIIDDCSTDNSIEVIKSANENDSRIKLIKLSKNVGVAEARNIGIKEAKGQFIAFLDSDDLWYPDKLEKQIGFMKENNIDFCYTGYEKVDEEGKSFQTMKVPLKISYKELLKTCYIGCLTVIYDTKNLGKIYMPTNTKREDYATWLSILKQTQYAYAVPETLAKYRVYSNQSSSKKINMAQENWNLYHNIENLNIFKTLYYFSHYAVNGLIRTKLPLLSEIIERNKDFK